MPNDKIKPQDDSVLTPVESPFNLDLNNVDIPILTPNIDLENINQAVTKQFENLQTFEDRVNYANKIFNKGSFLRDFLIAVLGGIVVLAVEHWNYIYNFILNMIN